MKIICFIDSLNSGGAQNQLVELAKGFKSCGHEVMVLVYHNLDFFKAQLLADNIQITLIQEPHFIKRIIKCRSAINHFEPDVVLSFLEVPNFIATIAGFPYRKWKLFVGERSADPQILKSRIKKAFRYFHLFTDGVISNSFANNEMVVSINSFIKLKSSVIYNFSKFPFKKLNGNNKKNTKKIEVVVVARHDKVKNASGMLTALSYLTKDEQEKIHINWYGTRNTIDNEFINTQQLLIDFKLQKVVSFHDAINNVLDVMNSSDVVGLFSLFEGLPNTVCEAMSLGKLVICSNVSDVPILLGNNKDILFDPKNPVDILRVLRNLIEMKDHDRKIIEQANYKFAIENFDKVKIISKYLNLFNE